jgi:TrmH family RNA methyltransferase
MLSSGSGRQVRLVEKLNRQAKARRENGLFVVEGRKEVLEAPISRIRAVYYTEAASDTAARLLKAGLPSDVLQQVTTEVFRKMADTQTPQGILALVSIQRLRVSQLLDMAEKGAEPALFLILEDLQDPGNVGTILRMAEAAGVTGVIVSRNTADIYSPKTVRATMGAIYRVPVAETDDVAGTIHELRDRGVQTCAAWLPGSVSYTEPDYRKATAFVIGNEGNGLRQETAEAAELKIRIPMKGAVESLNAAVAATVLAYEAARQRLLSR